MNGLRPSCFTASLCSFSFPLCHYKESEETATLMNLAQHRSNYPGVHNCKGVLILACGEGGKRSTTKAFIETGNYNILYIACMPIFGL